MAYGIANVDVIQSSTAGTPPQFNDGNGTQVGTLCRAWVNFNGVTTATIRASFNVSSVTRNSTGDYTINFTTAMADANYSYSLSGSQVSADCSNINPKDAGFSTSSLRIATFNTDTTPLSRDYDLLSVSIFR